MNALCFLYIVVKRLYTSIKHEKINISHTIIALELLTVFFDEKLKLAKAKWS